MKNSILSFLIIISSLFVSLAQSNTTLSVYLYPVQIIEHNSIGDDNDLDNIQEDSYLNTFSTSDFTVKTIQKDSIEYTSVLANTVERSKNKISRTKNYRLKDAGKNQSSVKTKVYKHSPHIVYSIEAL